MTSQTPIASTPFLPPALEPVTMDVNATHTCEEFMCQMCGRCFGCRSTVHSKREGNHEQDLCSYCRHIGHREDVCMDKFMGKSKGQKAVATMGEVGTGVNTPS